MNEERHIDWDDEDAGYDAFEDAAGEVTQDEESGSAYQVPTAKDMEVPGADGQDEVPEDSGEEAPEDPEVAQQRVRDLLTKMNGQRRTLLKILDFCRDQVAVCEINAAIEGWLSHNQSVFAPTTLCELLQQAGGLRHVNADGTDYDPKAAAAQAEEQAAEQASQEAVGAVEEEDEVRFEEVSQAPETYWITTPAGIAVADEDDPVSRAYQLLEDDGYYLPVYREVLEAIASQPRSKIDIDAIVRPHPLTQKPQRLSGYFLDRLERCEAIEWVDRWTITELGRELLEGGALCQ